MLNEKALRAPLQFYQRVTGNVALKSDDKCNGPGDAFQKCHGARNALSINLRCFYYDAFLNSKITVTVFVTVLKRDRNETVGF